MMAQYPAEKIAELSYRYRTLGLGYANIGGLLMASGIAYDSRRGPRARAARMTALMTGTAYAASAEMAGELGPFAGFAREPRGDAAGDPQPPARRPRRDARLRGPVGPAGAARCRARAGRASWSRRPAQAWDRALGAAQAHGYRNAQVTVIAPTGTIGLVMDCDTTGIEPDFALVKFKKLAGGGYFKIINRMVPKALAHARLRARAGRRHRRATRSAAARSRARPRSTTRRSRPRASRPRRWTRSRRALPSAFDIRYAFNQLHAGRSLLPGRARHRPTPAARRPALRPARGARLHAARRSRPPTTTSAAP